MPGDSQSRGTVPTPAKGVDPSAPHIYEFILVVPCTLASVKSKQWTLAESQDVKALSPRSFWYATGGDMLHELTFESLFRVSATQGYTYSMHVGFRHVVLREVKNRTFLSVDTRNVRLTRFFYSTVS